MPRRPGTSPTARDRADGSAADEPLCHALRASPATASGWELEYRRDRLRLDQTMRASELAARHTCPQRATVAGYTRDLLQPTNADGQRLQPLAEGLYLDLQRELVAYRGGQRLLADSFHDFQKTAVLASTAGITMGLGKLGYGMVQGYQEATTNGAAMLVQSVPLTAWAGIGLHAVNESHPPVAALAGRRAGSAPGRLQPHRTHGRADHHRPHHGRGQRLARALPRCRRPGPVRRVRDRLAPGAPRLRHRGRRDPAGGPGAVPRATPTAASTRTRPASRGRCAYASNATVGPSPAPKSANTSSKRVR